MVIAFSFKLNYCCIFVALYKKLITENGQK